MKITFIFFIFCLTVSNSFGSERKFSRIYLGASVDDSVYTVENSTGRSALMYSSSRVINPAIGYEVLPRPFVDSFGFRVLRWSVGISGQKFHANRQVIKDDRVHDASGINDHNAGDEFDLGTSIKGESYYITPALHLYFEIFDWFHAYLGFGVGAGYSNVRGNYYLTDGTAANAACLGSTTLATIKANCELQETNFHKTSLASSAFAGATFGFMGYRYTRGGPTYSLNGLKHSVRNDSGMLYIHFAW